MHKDIFLLRVRNKWLLLLLLLRPQNQSFDLVIDQIGLGKLIRQNMYGNIYNTRSCCLLEI